MRSGDWGGESRRTGVYENRDKRYDGVQLRQLDEKSLDKKSADKAHQTEEAKLCGKEAIRAAAEAAADLMKQSRSYPGIEWAVGVFEEAGTASLYATSNEGAGFLPPGLHWDLRLRHVFGPSVPESELGLCLCLANPSRTVLDHYFLLRSRRPALRLTAIASTQHPGAEVADALHKLGAKAVPSAQNKAASPNRAPNRLHAIAGETFNETILSIPVRELWASGLDLVSDLARRVEVHKTDPGIAAAIDELRAGKVAPQALEQSLRAYWRHSSQAQSRRVPDTRLGPVDTSSTGTTFEQAVALSAAIEYCPSFFAARASWMLHTLLESRLKDKPLGKAELAELAYEHTFVAERLEPTKSILEQRGQALIARQQHNR